MKKSMKITGEKTSIKGCVMVFVIILIIFLLFAGLFYRKKEINREDLDIWLGAYSYSELYKFDDENVDVHFGLIIYKDDGNYYAEFKNTGDSLRVQDYSVILQSRSLAYIKGNEESIDICFKSTLPGDSLYGISERYKKNELLLTLTYSDYELQTSWHALQEEEPVLGESEEKMEGAYFRKIYVSTMGSLRDR